MLKYKHRLNWLGGRLGAYFIRFVHRSSQLLNDPQESRREVEKHHPCIFAMWHGQFMMIPALSPPGIPVANMVARHGDAELIGAALERFDMVLIRGAGAGEKSKDKGGATALREALRALGDDVSVAMTADVPPGPARRAGTGIVKLAQLSGRPIVPVAAATSRFRALRTWSRMTINLPFSKLGVVLGKPIYVAHDSSVEALEAARKAVEVGLDEATREVYALVGGDLTAATPHTALPPEAPPENAGLGLKTYRLATRLAAPAAPLILGYRRRRGKEDQLRSAERLGQASLQRPNGLLVWIHAASVGETNAILPLMESLRMRRPEVQFLLTTGTVTSAQLAAERLDARDIHQYAPLDAPQCVANFLDHWQPNLALLTESELWPNTILDCHTKDIPLAIVNGRMSDRSYRRWRKNSGLAHPLFGRLRLVLAQNRQLARRFRELGARDVRSVGNLKIDAPKLPVDPVKQSELRAAIANRPVWIAASTHPGEEDAVIAAHRRLTEDFPDLLTVIAPRHPARGGDISGQARAAGLQTAQRSAGELPGADTSIYVADTIGEIGTFYSLIPIAFIGGSLIQRGGQNPIEAVRFDTTVITGPDQSNFADAYRELLSNHGAVQIEDAATLAEAVKLFLSDEVERARIGKGAASALQSLSGALQRTTDALLPLLPEEDRGLRRAS